MARELILRLKPPSAKGAQYLLQQLATAVAAVGDGGKNAMANMSTRVNCVGPRDAILTLVPNDSVSDEQLQAVAKIATTFSGPFRVEAEIGAEVVAAPAATRAAPTPAPAPAPEPPAEPAADPAAEVTIEEPAADGENSEEIPPYSAWKVEALREECGNRLLKKSGNKDELIARLEADDADDADTDTE